MQKEWLPLSGGGAFAPILPPDPTRMPTDRSYPQTVRAQTAFISTIETTTSSSYTDLTTVGPQVEIAAGPSGLFLVTLYCGLRTTVTNGCFMSFTFTGGVATAANDNLAISSDVGNFGQRIGGSFLVTDLGAALVTITCKYRATAGATAEFRDRRLSVVPL